MHVEHTVSKQLNCWTPVGLLARDFHAFHVRHVLLVWVPEVMFGAWRQCVGNSARNRVTLCRRNSASEFLVEATKDLFARAKEAQMLGISGSSLR